MKNKETQRQKKEARLQGGFFAYLDFSCAHEEYHRNNRTFWRS